LRRNLQQRVSIPLLSLKERKGRNLREYSKRKKYQDSIDEIGELPNFLQEGSVHSPTENSSYSNSLPLIESAGMIESEKAVSVHNLYQLLERVERTPEHLIQLISDLPIIQRCECSVRFNEDKKWRHGCTISITDQLLFIHSLYKKFRRKPREIFEGLFCLNDAQCSEEENVIKIISGKDCIYMTELINQSYWMSTFEGLIKYLNELPKTDNVISQYHREQSNSLESIKSSKHQIRSKVRQSLDCSKQNQISDNFPSPVEVKSTDPIIKRHSLIEKSAFMEAVAMIKESEHNPIMLPLHQIKHTNSKHRRKRHSKLTNQRNFSKVEI